ncbi:molybdopterin molybdotransferase MoeA [Romboutsia hominis]|uniref:Molybdopterin molybdenumtransferase n=1 Tax=Romboutsia hominis TaxID=1507512 RepID=A0A2P2BSF0_9FIRM|nr:molybdopterin molybdotransferase MoeA [Romboutsia hominis]CEI73252.1 Molybdopterin molybdenumtransferase [Romboutsia hominis]
MKLFDVTTVDNVLEIMKNKFKKDIMSEKVSLIDSLNRYISDDIKSNINVPHFRKSLVDGYSVLFNDVFLASESNPVCLNKIDESYMGKICNTLLEEETCVYTPTGAMVPKNSQGVVMIEYCEVLNEKEILIQNSIAFNENIVEVGEDIKENEVLYEKGHLINERDIGVLAGSNIKEIDVYEKLTVGIISTGDEILDISEDIKEAKIKDINAYILYGQLKNINLNPIIYPSAKDNLNDIINLIKKALNECDIILISGGSSVGKKDETLKAIESFENSEVLVEGIAIKPGKPTIIANICNKLVMGLPGHPLSCAFVIEAIFKQYIKSLYNIDKEEYTLCEFTYNYHKAKGREEYLGVNIGKKDNKLVCVPIFSKSSTIKQFAKCDGYIKIDRDLEGIKNGDIVKVYTF